MKNLKATVLASSPKLYNPAIAAIEKLHRRHIFHQLRCKRMTLNDSTPSPLCYPHRLILRYGYSCGKKKNIFYLCYYINRGGNRAPPLTITFSLTCHIFFFIHDVKYHHFQFHFKNFFHSFRSRVIGNGWNANINARTLLKLSNFYV